MKAKEYKRILAVVLSAGMIASQPMMTIAAAESVQAVEGVPEEEMPEVTVEETPEVQTEAPPEAPVETPPEVPEETPEAPEETPEVRQAASVDGSGEMIDISEEVLGMLEDGSVYQNEETKMLHDAVTHEKVDPVTGERVKETPEEKPEVRQAASVDGSGKMIDISEKVLKMLEDGSVYQDEKTKMLHDKITLEKVDPVTGERVKEVKPEEKPEETPEEKPEEAPAETPEVVPEETPKEEVPVEDTKPEPEVTTKESLIARQNIIKLPEIKKDFRFWTIARVYAFAKENVSIKEEMTDTARDIGTLKKNGLMYILQEEEGGWLYVESGTVRGFVKAADVHKDDEAKDLLQKYQEEAKAKAKKDNKKYAGIESVVSVARQLISQDQNNAFLHTLSTTKRTVVDKKYALTTVALLNIREGKSTDSRVIGTLKPNSLCYILADEDEEWVYVESGDVRGFINKKYLKTGNEVEKQVKEAGEDTFPTAQEMIKHDQNQACYYTMTSIKSGVPSSKVRESILEFASQFIGNAYVWGGTSLTDGADCSGFVQSIYREYGYAIPRVAEDQAQYGTKIAVEDAQPGDLIFYADSTGYIYHVVMYAGDGKTVEAMNSDIGIVQATVNTADAVWATRILEEERPQYGSISSDVGEVNATEDMYGEYLGNFGLTYYCACAICCDVETGITATGTTVSEGRTIAVDPTVIPYGSQVIIAGHVFTAEDCGGAIKQNRIDIYISDHERALQMGLREADVYMVK